VGAKVTLKGQVTLPKAVREAAGIRPGDLVSVRARSEGGVVVEKTEGALPTGEYRQRLEEMARRKPFRGFMTDGLMTLTRGEE
jgi:AbrB family looped-hinge helix DNA binding protein